ncbi:AraC family transcriptional regulator [Symbioplanes lichenis]|uniref:AraC family transcriptional regulator n=1 Tax=Symbioplanes lichenis TaxID=1629072 RepID=UPI00273A4116|nr:AraC family transcriptional regulator [Actinoplanes lichenis]
MDKITEAVATTRAGRAVATRNRFAGEWSTRFPEINGSALHIVRRGAPWLSTGRRAPVPTKPGDVVFLPFGPPHGFSHAPAPLSGMPPVETRLPHSGPYDIEVVSCCYHLDRGRVHESFRGLPEAVTVNLDEQGDPALRAVADLLVEHAAGDGPGRDIALPAVVDLLLVHLLRVRPGDGETVDPPIARALRAVRDDPHKAWTAAQLSGVAGLSRAVFARRFTAAIGEPPGAYLLKRRLDQGAQLLRYTELPLAAIAARLGYATEFSFAAAFRREFGIAPGRFRRRERAVS